LLYFVHSKHNQTTHDSQQHQRNQQNYWFKIVEFLPTNWALIEEHSDSKATVSFINDTSGTFDEITYDTLQQAVNEVMDNGFNLYSQAPYVHRFLKPLTLPSKPVQHINDVIPSNGHFLDRK
jgi:hypothetical protein